MIPVLFIAQTIGQTIAPVRLAQDAAAVTNGTDVPWSSVAIACSLVLMVSLALVVWKWARSRGLPAEERAFRAMAWRLHLGPVTRRRIRRASATSGVPAVALLLSDAARRTAGLSTPHVPVDPT
jgi:hypothetical protein